MPQRARYIRRDAGATHLLVGAEVLVPTRDIVAILGEQAFSSAATQEFIGFCGRRGLVTDVTDGEPVKAAVICRVRVLLSPFSSATLRRRIAAVGLP